MRTIFLKIAGFTIAIKLHPTEWPYYIERRFEGDITYHYNGFIVKDRNGKIHYTIEMKHAQNLEVLMQTHKKRTYVHFFEEAKSNSIVSYYHISDMQFQLILRKIIQKLLAEKNGLIFHASASLVKKKVYVFLGKSGAGKSTAVLLLAVNYKPLADDSIIIVKEKGKFYVYQTPFPEQSFWIKKNSDRYVLGKLFFLEKTTIHKIEKLNSKEYITNRFLNQLLTEIDDVKKQMPAVLSLIGMHDNFYRLSFSLHNAQKMVELVVNLP